MTAGWKSLIGSIATGCFVSAVLSAPMRPEDDNQILETLPRSSEAVFRDLRAMRSTLEKKPGQADLAVSLAKKYIEAGKSESDPRYYGYAQGALEPWWQQAEPPAEVLLLRALILQNQHDFGGALSDLEKLLKRQPENAEAWLTQAVILHVQARYIEAQQSCAALIHLDAPLVAATCLSQTASLTGHGLKSYRFLTENLESAADASPEQKQWALTVLAEMAVRLEKYDSADRHFTEAVRIRRPDAYLTAAYADFLLDRRRPEEAAALLSDKTRINSLLLRLALARQQMNASDLPGLISAIQDRFAASRLRRENLHQGDEARFNLHLLKQPQAALKLAKANWQTQKEPKDARILLETAIAANDPEAAKPVLDLMKQTGMEHAQLQQLANRLKETK